MTFDIRPEDTSYGSISGSSISVSKTEGNQTIGSSWSAPTITPASSNKGKYTADPATCKWYYKMGSDAITTASYTLDQIKALTLTDNLVLYPVWTTNWTVSFAMDSADSTKGSITGTDIYVTPGSKVTNAQWTAANPAATTTNFQDGYVIDTTKPWKWKVGSGAYVTGTQSDFLNLAITDNVVVSPNFTRLSGYQVTLDLQGGSTTATKTSWTAADGLYYDSSITLPAADTMSKSEYVFNGWWTAASGGTQISAGTPTYKDILNASGAATKDETNKGPVTLYARWTKQVYTVTFKVVGMANVGASPTDRTYNPEFSGTVNIDGETAPAAATGYKFDGWYDAQTGGTKKTGTPSYSTLVGGDSTKTSYTLYARFVEDVVEVTFKVADGSTSAITQLSGNSKTGQTITIYVSAATGYICTSNDISTKTTTTKVGAITPTFAAGYEYGSWAWAPTLGNSGTLANNATITTATGAIAIKAYNSAYRGGTYTLTANAKATTYRIEHYKENLDGTYTMTSETNSNGVTGQWVKIAGWDGDANVTITPTPGTGFTYSPTLTGGTPVAGKPGIGRIQLVYTSTGDATCPNIIRIYYSRNSYTLTANWTGVTIADDRVFKVDGVAQNNTATVKYGQTVTFDTPSKAGYVFVEWDYNGNKALTQSFTMPANDVTVTGKWRTAAYRLVFKNDDRPSIGGTTPNNWGIFSGGTSWLTYTGAAGTPNAQANGTLSSGAKLRNGGSGNSAPTASPSGDAYEFLGWEYNNGTTTVLWGKDGSGELTILPLYFQIDTSAGATGSAYDGTIYFTARWGKKHTVTYAPYNAFGNFTSVTFTDIRADEAGNDPSLANYSYASKPGEVDTPATNALNAGNPKAQPGYVFVGWRWDMYEKDDSGNEVQRHYTTWAADTSSTYTKYSTVNPSNNPFDGNIKVNQDLSFIAIFQPTTQEIVFDTADAHATFTWNSGSAPTYGESNRKTGSTIALPAASTYKTPGYSVKWVVTDGANNGTSYNPGANYTVAAGVYDASKNANVITFKAVYTPITVTIKYEYGTGYGPAWGTISKSTETINSNEWDTSVISTFGSVATSKDHYKFVGWYKDAACTQAVPGPWLVDVTADKTAKIVPQKDGTTGLYVGATYYAKFAQVPYEITYIAKAPDTVTSHYDGGTLSKTSASPVYYGENPYKDASQNLRTVLTVKNGYTHTGWGYYTNPGALTGWTTLDKEFKKNGTVYSVTGDVTFYALYELRTDYSITFAGLKETSLNKKYEGYKWTDAAASKLPAGYDTAAGYTFNGWYLSTNPTNVFTNYSTITFEDVAKIIASPDGNGITTFTLYASWTAKTGYTVHYDLACTDANPSTIPDCTWDPNNTSKHISWESTNFTSERAAGPTPTRNGWTFKGWWLEAADCNGSHDQCHEVKVKDPYSFLAGGNDSLDHSVTLTAHWERKVYQVVYMGNCDGYPTTVTTIAHSGSANDSTKYPGLGMVDTMEWDTIIPNFTPTWADHTFLGWSCNGNTIYTKDAAATKRISNIGLATDPTNSIYTLTALWSGNPSYKIEYHYILRDPNNINNDLPQSATVHTIDGKLAVGETLDYANFKLNPSDTTTVNLWDLWTTQVAAAKRLGYVAATDYAGNVLNEGVTVEATNPLYTFKLYFREKAYTLDFYQEDGTTLYPSTDIPSKQAPFTSSPALSASDPTPTKPGYTFNGWTYNGTKVTNQTVKELLNPITITTDTPDTLKLIASWTENKTNITYSIYCPGDIGAGTLSNERDQVLAEHGTVNGSTLTFDPATHEFVGWAYRVGSDWVAIDASDPKWAGWLSNDGKTITPQKENGVYVDREYFARINKLEDLSYTVEHYFQNANGVYVLGDTDYNQPGVDKQTYYAANHVKTTTLPKGLSYDPTHADSISSITLDKNNGDGRTLKLYYKRVQYTIEAFLYEGTADHPTTADTPNAPTSLDTSMYEEGGLPKKFYYEADAPLPGFPAGTSYAGWTLKWKIVGDTTTEVAGNAGTFKVPSAENTGGVVKIYGVWSRVNYTVTFGKSAAHLSDSNFVVSESTTTVAYGKKLSESPISWPTTGWRGNSGSGAKVTISTPAGYELTGWEVYEQGSSTLLDTLGKDGPVTYAVTKNLIFRAVWSETLVITYVPGDKAADTPASNKAVQTYDGYIAADNTPLPTWDATKSNGTDHPLAKNGYEFIGWKWSVTEMGTTTTYAYVLAGKPLPAGAIASAMPVTVDKSYEFQAIIVPLERQLNFTIDATNTTWNDGTAAPNPKTLTKKTDENVAPSEWPLATREGYLLKGWKIDGTSDDDVIVLSTSWTVPYGDGSPLNFVPVWKINGTDITYTVVSGSHGRLTNSEDTVGANDATAPGSAPIADAGYVFVGWFTDAAGNNPVNASWVDASNKLTPHADSGTPGDYIWTAKTYYAKFAPGNDTKITIKYYKMDTEGAYDTTTPFATEVKTGLTTEQTYYFMDFNITDSTVKADSRLYGFYLDPTNHGEDRFVTAIGGDTGVLHVFFARVKNDIRYELDNGTKPPTATLSRTEDTDVYYEKTMTVPTVSNYDGYILRWEATYNDGTTKPLTINPDGTFTMPAGAVSAIVYFDNPVYKIVFESTQTIPADKLNTMPSEHNTDFFARYNQSGTNNNIAWLGTGWLPMDSNTHTTVHEPVIPGKQFTGWAYLDETGNYRAVTDATTFADLVIGQTDKTIGRMYALWTDLAYDVIFKYAPEDGGSTIATTTSGWNDDVTKTNVVPTKEGFSFSHWLFKCNDFERRFDQLTNKTYSTLAGLQGLTEETARTSGVVFEAVFTENKTFTIVIYKGGYDESGNLVPGTAYKTYSDPDYQYDPSATVTIAPNGDTKKIMITLTGTALAGITLPSSVALSIAPGYFYDASCDVAGIYSTALGNELRVVLKPRTDYNVEYVVKYDDGRTVVLNTLTGVTWDKAGLLDEAPSTSAIAAGYSVDGGWYYLNESGFPKFDLDNIKTYGQIVKDVFGSANSTKTKLTMLINAKAQTYHVVFVDDTDIPAVTILDKDGYGWTGRVDITDPANLVTPGYSKPGYEWTGWELRDAAGNALNQYPANTASVTYDVLAGLMGLTDATAIDTPVKLFAMWAKYQPITIWLYVDNDTDEANKLDATKQYTAADEKVLTGGTWTLANDADAMAFVNANRPAGYRVATLPVLNGAVEGENILHVIYEKIANFKLTLKTGYGDNAVVNTYTYGWNDVVDPDLAKIVDEPTRMGYNLQDKPERWNTKMNGAGDFLDGVMTYAQLAAKIYGAALRDTAILDSAEGLVLYATWAMANHFEVHYDFNNDRNINTSIKSDFDPDFDATRAEELKESNVRWDQSGFDKDHDYLAFAAPYGYEFDHWNTAADGSGIKVSDAHTYAQLSQIISLAETGEQVARDMIKLFAQWREILVEIKYVVDDATHGTVDRDVDKLTAVTQVATSEGSSPGQQLHSVATAKPGWHFVEWRLLSNMSRALTGQNVMTTLGADNSELQISSHENDGRLYGATYQAIFARNADASIEYDRNDDLENDIIGTGTINPTTAAHGTTVSLNNGAAYKRDHYKLVGWNTKADGTGTSYKLGQTGIVMPEDGMKLYAQWELVSHGIHVNDPVDGGTLEGPKDTKVEWGEKIPQSFVDSLKPNPRPGWTHTGWSYVITDPITGEKTTGFTTDPTELTVTGDVELTPVFEGADPVVEDGPPRTGDTGLAGFEFAWLLIAALMGFFLLVAARRREEREDA